MRVDLELGKELWHVRAIDTSLLIGLLLMSLKCAFRVGLGDLQWASFWFSGREVETLKLIKIGDFSFHVSSFKILLSQFLTRSFYMF